MTLSMTAFARRSADFPAGALIWELRSVNHRYLDIGLRLPDELRAIEAGARELIAKRVERGKVDATLKFQAKDSVAGLTFDAIAARQLLGAGVEVRQLAADLAPMSVHDVLRWPGVLRSPAFDADALGNDALKLFAATLDELVATRAREGERLRATLEERLRSIRESLERLATIDSWGPSRTT